MPQDRRIYTRYPITVEGKVAHEKGYNFTAKILDLSIEGVRLKIDAIYPLNENDLLFLVFKAQKPIKLKARIKWIKKTEHELEVGLKFESLDIETTQNLSTLLSEIALSQLSDSYLR